MTPLAVGVAAEVRALLALRSTPAVRVAPLIGRSQNYLAIRLRGEAPLTLDDVVRIVEAVAPDLDPGQWLIGAIRRGGSPIPS